MKANSLELLSQLVIVWRLSDPLGRDCHDQRARAFPKLKLLFSVDTVRIACRQGVDNSSTIHKAFRDVLNRGKVNIQIKI